MNYEKFRTIRDRETFFDDWEDSVVSQLTEEIKNDIYQKYFVKCIIFQKANFKCENEGCDSNTNLTLHHIKFQKNNGKTTVKNGACICKTCHKAFHRGKKPLTINNATYQLHITQSINWKQIKQETKVVRKNNKEEHGIKISWELILLLMKFLDIEYKESMEDNFDGDDD